MTTTNHMKSRRLAPGYYEVATPVGTFDVYRWDATDEWAMNLPGEQAPADLFRTKADAMDAVADVVADPDTYL